MFVVVEVGFSDSGYFRIFLLYSRPEALDLGKAQDQQCQEFLVPPFEGKVRTYFELTKVEFLNEVDILFFQSFQFLVEDLDFVGSDFALLDFQGVLGVDFTE